ncbi:hypothetical protein [Microbacterium sp. JB110]|uniref:hypothetical protein n=1 Tax=Microbacterium sp. JB110 TaxID=2024477 RepID=UPI00097EEC46|nr:hypothetical protein [Microbacterium sp. JB110]RCS58805.1 hypothetical protein CIK77_13915 [Microbacterium sp. JB110]SJM54660.1 hypothetical protein CZ774_06835 [Frigoribacterium sp. JB110]
MPTFESRNRHRRITAALGALGALALVVACAPEPDPEPTGFATEEEALEAARETYEGYVEATNQLDFSAPATAEPVYEWLTGQALADERKVFTEAHADKLSRAGASSVTLVELATEDIAGSEFAVNACVDVSNVQVFDESGEVLSFEDRPDVQPVLVAVVISESSSSGLLISSMEGREGNPTCDVQ